MSETQSYIPPEATPRIEARAKPKITWESVEAAVQKLIKIHGSIRAAVSLLEKLEDTDPNDRRALLEIQNNIAKISEKKRRAELPQFPDKHKPSEEESHSLQQLHDTLKNVKANGESLGKGSTAEVFRDTNNQNICYKIIFNGKLYAKHNHVNTEADLLARLANVVVNGTRVPKSYYSAGTKDFQVLAMEALVATTLEDIITNKQPLPKNFNEAVFFSNLEKFVESMHALGIYHRDLHEGNIMVDKETALPYVIDFGLACHSLNNENPYLDTNTHSKEAVTYTNDDDNIRGARLKVKKYLRSRK